MLFHAITIFLSAFLLFQVQPMIAKMILPWFGGTAAVWATCLLFFQAVLLAGYAYAHGLVRRLPPSRQWMLHAALLVAALFILPVTPDEAWKPVDPTAPAWRILAVLGATIGLPYFLLSTTGPLVQAWYVQKHPGGIPYRLFALSNLGSMLALLSYPPLIEPNLTLGRQSFVWSIGFGVFALLCAYTGWLSRAPAPAAAQEMAEPVETAPAPTRGLMALWVALAAAASMLLMTVTSHMSMDVAPIPFLWVLPLALYLLTFIIAFDADGWYRRPVFLGLLPVAFGIMCWLLMSDPTERPEMKAVIALFAIAFFLACMVCHGELARLKPHPAHLTVFYFMISLGGALGGVFVALIAPAAFNAYYEFPIAIVFCVLVVLATLYVDKESVFRRELLGWPSIGVVTLASLITGVNARIVRDMVTGNMVVVRNFYGEMSVRQYGDLYEWDSYRTLVHGAINHGEQYTHPARRREPAAYYCKDAGIALAVNARPIGVPQKIAVIGLGTGTLAAYARPGDLYRFYEINPLVENIANDYFTYLKDTEAVTEIVLGDARLSLEREAPQGYDVIAVDAFSSDSIPVHLLTIEAMRLYKKHLKEDGILGVHISNRYVDLEPVVARAAAELGRRAWMITTQDNDDGSCYGTNWVLLTAREELLETDEFRLNGREAVPPSNMRLWTDDYSNVFRVMQ
ncbi:MAG: fused MFS/spermidine synthase [Bryobacteraceae bacterium]|nr:fused MFS/spermidine synthase [Bryobacteraceae bacterium]MCL4797220.1 fused MFS/spermidine synthase [Bryobacteraceae bacterium]